MDVSDKVAKILLDIKAVALNADKPFRYSSGILSPVYTDCRILISFPKERKIIRDLLVEKIQSVDVKINCIAGTATAGIPHAAWIADKLELPMIYVRSKPKNYGKENLIEGKLEKGQTVAVIEDLISTGESSVNTVKAVRSSGGASQYIFSIITYGMKKADDNMKNANITLVSLTDFETVVSVAKQNNYIKETDEAIIVDWISDPSGWGAKMGHV